MQSHGSPSSFASHQARGSGCKTMYTRLTENIEMNMSYSYIYSAGIIRCELITRVPAIFVNVSTVVKNMEAEENHSYMLICVGLVGQFKMSNR